MKHALPWAAVIILLVTVGCASIQPAPDTAIEEANSADTSSVARPQAPAPPDDYRADSPDLIGASTARRVLRLLVYHLPLHAPHRAPIGS